MLNVAILVRVCPYCEQIAHVGDEHVVPSGCDYERGDALRVGHDDVADIVHFGPKYNIDFDEGSQTLKKCECETCGKKCARKCELKRHILSVHNEHSYHCSDCDLKFGTKDAMIRHKKNAHMANDFM